MHCASKDKIPKTLHLTMWEINGFKWSTHVISKTKAHIFLKEWKGFSKMGVIRYVNNAFILAMKELWSAPFVTLIGAIMSPMHAVHYWKIMNILLNDKFKNFDFKDFHHIVKNCQSFVTNSTINHLVIQSIFKKDSLFYNRFLLKFDVIEGTKGWDSIASQLWARVKLRFGKSINELFVHNLLKSNALQLV